MRCRLFPAPSWFTNCADIARPGNSHLLIPVSPPFPRATLMIARGNNIQKSLLPEAPNLS